MKNFKNMDLVICDVCKSYLHKNHWKKAFSNEIGRNIARIINKTLREKIVINQGVDIESISIKAGLPRDVKFGGGTIINVELRIKIFGEKKDVKINEDHVIPLKVKFSTCNNCKKKGTQYFEAKLQIRPAKEKILNFVKTYCEESGMFISKIEEEKYGYDIYLNDQKEARNLGNILKREFGGELKISKKIFGKRDGRDIYRATVAILIDNEL